MQHYHYRHKIRGEADQTISTIFSMSTTIYVYNFTVTESEEKEIKGELLLKGVDTTTEVTKSHKKSQKVTRSNRKALYIEILLF